MQNINTFEDALKAIRGNSIQWTIPSDTKPGVFYTVSANPLTCTCDYFRNWFTFHKPQRPCKHLWKGPGALAVHFIDAIQNANTTDELEQVITKYAGAMQHVDELFKIVVRRIENDKREELLAPVQKPTHPMAKTMAELVTPRQLVAIRGISNSQKIDAEVECTELLQCKPEELSRRAASWFIDYLKEGRQSDSDSATPEQRRA